MTKPCNAVPKIALLWQITIPQTPTTPAQAIDSQDVVRISTSLVQTDVVVTDKNDQIISDLTLADFKVFENGKRQDLKFIEFVGVGAQPRVEGSLNVAGQPVEPAVTQNLSSGELRRVFAFVV